jgi:hypothetical protein
LVRVLRPIIETATDLVPIRDSNFIHRRGIGPKIHTTPGIPEHMPPTIALVTAGVEMDVLGIAYHDFTREQRDDVCAHHPRERNFKENIIAHYADGIIKKPETTFGNVKADVLAVKDPVHFVRGNFCSIILGSAWAH